jgi:hypothetical protein
MPLPVARRKSGRWTVLALVVVLALPSISLLPSAAAADDRASAIVTVDPNTTYQTITSWEATAWMGQDSNPNFDNYSDAVLDMAVEELGLNRLRLELRAGVENPEDYWTQYQTGVVDYDFWRSHRYSTVNDDADPDTINWSSFHFSELDNTVEKVVLPFVQRVVARGETPLVNLNYVAFTAQNGAGLQYIHDDPDEYAELMLATFIHLEGNYSLVPDLIEVILEPDNVAQWNGYTVGSAIVATKAKLAVHGYNPTFIAPSTTNMGGAVSYFDQMATVTGAVAALSELSYHRYSGVSDTNLRALDLRRVQNGIRTSMLEHIGSGHADLVDDLTLANCSSWQQFTLAGVGGTDDGGAYLLVDDTVPSDPVVTMGSRTKFLQQYFAYVRPGATRIGATSSDASAEPAAFTNPSGEVVVVVSATEGSTFTVQGLPAGTYGITYTTSAEHHVALPNATIAAGGTVYASIPAAGVMTLREIPGAPAVDFTPSDPDVDVYEGYSVDFWATPRDVDPSELAFEWTLDGMRVATSVATFRYITDYDSAGDHELVVTVTDPGTVSPPTIFTWYVTVLNVNRGPEVTDSSPDSYTEVNESDGGSVTFSVVANDPDGDDLTYIWQVDYIEVDRGDSAAYVFTYDHSSSGNHYIQVAVTDGVETEYVQWTLSVQDVNRPPTIISRDPGERVTVEETDYGYLTLSVQVYDPDGDYVTYEWEMDGDTLYGARSDTYTFSYSHGSAGTYVIRVTASDGEDQVEAAWLVTVADVNMPPTISSAYPYYNPTYYETEQGSVTLSVTAYDEEDDDLTYNWTVDDVPMASGPEAAFNFTFDFDSAGDHMVNVTVSDGHNETAWTWTVTIRDVNRPPVVASGIPVGNSTTHEEEALTLEVFASDPDGDELTYQWYLNSSTIYDADNSTYEFIPSEGALGTFVISVYIHDGQGGWVTHLWNVTVLKKPPRSHAALKVPGWLVIVVALAVVNTIFLVLVKTLGRPGSGGVQRGGSW